MVSIVLLISGNVLEDLLLWCHRLISDMALIMMTWWFETPLRSLWRHCNVAATASLSRRSMFAQGSPSFQRSLRPVLATGPLLRNWATVVGVLPKSLNGQPHLDSAMRYKVVIRAPNRPYHVLNVVPSRKSDFMELARSVFVRYLVTTIAMSLIMPWWRHQMETFSA